MVVDSLSSSSLSFAVALGGGEGFGVHDFLRRHLLQLGVEAERGGAAGVHQRLGEEAEVVVAVVAELQRRRPPAEEAGLLRRRRGEEELLVDRIEGVDRVEGPR